MSEDQTITMAAAAELIRQARADERERVQRELWPMIAAGEAEALATLRAQVEALSPWLFTNSPLMLAVSRTDVLALLDGEGE